VGTCTLLSRTVQPVCAPNEIPLLHASVVLVVTSAEGVVWDRRTRPGATELGSHGGRLRRVARRTAGPRTGLVGRRFDCMKGCTSGLGLSERWHGRHLASNAGGRRPTMSLRAVARSVSSSAQDRGHVLRPSWAHGRPPDGLSPGRSDFVKRSSGAIADSQPVEPHRRHSARVLPTRMRSSTR
jgi:hypothetical protein